MDVHRTVMSRRKNEIGPCHVDLYSLAWVIRATKLVGILSLGTTEGRVE